ncbi:MAG: methionyl-tRNA formyltransferase [Myxococcota bacterium]
MALRIALFGQAAFAREVLAGLADAGHEIVGVFAPPDGARPEPLADEAEARGLRLFRHPRFRRRGEAIPELVNEYLRLGADLNVLPFTTVILPPEIVEAPRFGSLCFHPSLLPRFRGGAALAWQIILGERESGVTIFQPDAGIDTGPIVVQRGGVGIEPTDTAGSLYFRALYALGIEAMLAAVDLVAESRAKPVAQDESCATFQGLVDDEVARLDWSRSAVELDRLVRGCDPQPGAHARREGEVVRLYDCRLGSGEGSELPGTLLDFREGRLVMAARGGRLEVGRVRLGSGGKVPAEGSGLRVGERLQ